MRWSIYIVACMVALALAAPSAASVELGRYHALVIGSNDYEHLPRLKTAVNDASAVHDLLSREYGYQSTLLLNPTRQALIIAFDRLRAELTEHDNLLIFYAGHGYLDRATGEGFWLTVKATEDSQVEWLPVSTVTRLLKASLVKHALVVVDSCYSGILTRDAPVLLATGPARSAEIERLASKRARKALTSGGLEPVSDGGGDGYSVFTRALLESLRDNTEVIDGFQIYSKLRKAVVLNAEQTPEYADIRLAGDEGGDFLFVPTAARVAAAANPATSGAAPAPNTEILFWQSIQDSTAPSDYEAYLAQYPSGAFAMLARARAERYGRVQETAPARQPPPPPAPAAPQQEARVALVPVEALHVLVRNANIRAGPTVESRAVTTLPSGSEVYVSARTEDGQWLRVERDGKPLGFVYAPLLQEREAWNRARRDEAAARAKALEAATRHRQPAPAPPTATTAAASAAPRPAPPSQAGSPSAPTRTAALAPAANREHLATYLQRREKEFLGEIRDYDFKNHVFATATTSSQGSVPIPTNIARYEILEAAGNRFKLSILVDLSASYAGGDGPVDAKLILWVQRGSDKNTDRYVIVGHE